jgi:hypothetical protein
MPMRSGNVTWSRVRAPVTSSHVGPGWFPGGASVIGADPALGRFYRASGTICDATTYASIATVTRVGNILGMQMVPGDDRLYAMDASRLYVIQTQ